MGDDASEGIGRRLLEREATEPAAAAVDTRRHASGPGAGWSYGVKCVLTRVAGGWDNGISVDIFKNLIMVEWRTNAQLTVGCTQNQKSVTHNPLCTAYTVCRPASPRDTDIPAIRRAPRLREPWPCAPAHGHLGTRSICKSRMYIFARISHLRRIEG